jgi:rSAM/selenodomain-associated transferase 1
MRRRPTVILFTKEARIGRAKTRLASDIGRVAAWRFHRLVTQSLIGRLQRDRRWHLMLAVSPDTAARKGRWPRGVIVVPQGTGDLGRRMERALMSVGVGPVLLIGSDIPAVRPMHVDHAIRLLGRSDVVFGPADDGGYWLVGVRHPILAKGLFENVAWSTPQALADTAANALPRRRISLADRLVDVDDAGDLERLPVPYRRLFLKSG